MKRQCHKTVLASYSIQSVAHKLEVFRLEMFLKLEMLKLEMFELEWYYSSHAHSGFSPG